MAAEAAVAVRESWRRLVVKTIEWRLTGVLLGAAIGYLLTHSWSLGMAFGGICNVVRVVLMPIRERFWGRVAWGMEPRPSLHS